MAWTIYNNSALVQVMTWHRPVDKPLPKPMFISLSRSVIWITFSRWYHQMCFLKQNLLYCIFHFNFNFNVVCSYVSSWQNDSALHEVMAMRTGDKPAVTKVNGDPGKWWIYASPDLTVLTCIYKHIQNKYIYSIKNLETGLITFWALPGLPVIHRFKFNIHQYIQHLGICFSWF